jgi:hypothetical protein
MTYADNIKKNSELDKWPTQPPIQGAPGLLFLGVKWQGHEVDHSPPSNAEVENEWSYTSIPSVCLHGVEWEKLNFLYI